MEHSKIVLEVEKDNIQLFLKTLADYNKSLTADKKFLHVGLDETLVLANGDLKVFLYAGTPLAFYGLGIAMHKYYSSIELKHSKQ